MTLKLGGGVLSTLYPKQKEDLRKLMRERREDMIDAVIAASKEFVEESKKSDRARHARMGRYRNEVHDFMDEYAKAARPLEEFPDDEMTQMVKIADSRKYRNYE